jgi:hypothetical protein
MVRVVRFVNGVNSAWPGAHPFFSAQVISGAFFGGTSSLKKVVKNTLF